MEDSAEVVLVLVQNQYSSSYVRSVVPVRQATPNSLLPGGAMSSIAAASKVETKCSLMHWLELGMFQSHPRPVCSSLLMDWLVVVVVTRLTPR